MSNTNLLDLRPVRIMECRVEDDRLVVLVPRFRSRWMKWYLRLLSNPYIRYRLDAISEAVWQDCDGTQTVWDIGKNIQAKFGSKVEPVWERLAGLLKQMERGGMIRWGCGRRF